MLSRHCGTNSAHLFHQHPDGAWCQGIMPVWPCGTRGEHYPHEHVPGPWMCPGTSQPPRDITGPWYSTTMIDTAVHHQQEDP